MKNSTTKIKLCLGTVLCSAAVFAAVTSTVNFEGSTFTPDQEWSNYGQGTRVAVGTETMPASRSSEFSGPNQYYYTVDSGQELILRLIPGGEGSYIVIKDGEPAYVDMLVKFAASPAPDLDDDDKLCLWVDDDHNLHMMAGYYETSFGSSGIVSTNYTVSTDGSNPVTIPDGEWHRVAIKFFRPLYNRSFYHSGFEVFLDANPLKLCGSDTIASDDFAPVLEQSLVNGEGLEPYLDGRYFPTRLITGDTEKLKGLGMNGVGGGVDEIVITNENEPNTIADYSPATRYLMLGCQSGLDSVIYQVNSDPSNSTNLFGKATVLSIEVPSGDSQTVTISATMSESGRDLNLVSESPIADLVANTGSFTVNGAQTVYGRLELKPSDGNVCQLNGGTKYESVFKALDAIGDGGSGTIQLLCSTEEDIIISNRTVTLNLGDKSLTGVNQEQLPVIRVLEGGNLTIDGTGTISSPYACTGSLGTHQQCAGVTINGGKFKGSVNDLAHNLVLNGGSFYANGDLDNFTLQKAVDRSGKAKSWDGSEKCVNIVDASAPLSSPALSATAALLGMSAKSEAMLAASGAESPVIEISDLVTTVEDGKTKIVCTVNITVNGEGVDIAAVSLAQLVKVSGDLVNWTAPDIINYDSTGKAGEYTVTIIAPDGESRFLKLSEN